MQLLYETNQFLIRPYQNYNTLINIKETALLQHGSSKPVVSSRPCSSPEPSSQQGVLWRHPRNITSLSSIQFSAFPHSYPSSV